VNDRAVSELLGYAILAGTTIIAVIFLASGAGAMITSAIVKTELSSTATSMEAFASSACRAACDNNSYFTACEIAVPAGYRIYIVDGGDDFRSLSVYCGGEKRWSVRTGSARICSPFTSVCFEGGAVFINDSGLAGVEKRPSVYMVQDGKNVSLYLSMICLAADTGAPSKEGPVVLTVKAESQGSERWEVPAGAQTAIVVSTGDPEGWGCVFRDMGFAVSYNGSLVTATSGGVSGVYASHTVVQVACSR
jgi:hypothetical protein